MTGEFSGLGLAVGVVRGARAFDVDALGRLTGVSYPQVWTPAENVAECRAPKTTPTDIAGAGITWVRFARLLVWPAVALLIAIAIAIGLVLTAHPWSAS